MYPPFHSVLEITNSLLSVLLYLEQRDLIHSDLNPLSIMLFGGPKIMLKNFGFSIQMIRDPMNLPSHHKTRQKTTFTAPEI